MPPQPDSDLTIRIGRDELTLRRRYETLSIANDILIALWFIVGSWLFFSPDTSDAATWLFLIGSVQMLIRPAIRLTRHVHLGRAGAGSPETRRDF